MDLGVAGQPFLIVGGTRGMGLATASVLAEDGAHVVIAGRDASHAASTAAELSSQFGTQVIGLAADVSTIGGAEHLVAEATAALGGLRGLAVLTGTEGHVPIDGLGHDDWHRITDDVLVATVKLVEAALPRLVEGGGGTIVTTSAYSIRSPHDVRLPYTSLKAAVAVFTKGIAKAYGKHGVRANCVCPGAIETEHMAATRARLAAERGVPPEGLLERLMVDEWHLDVAMGRPGRPREVGELMALLLSPRAGYLTGTTINIDGGTDF